MLLLTGNLFGEAMTVIRVKTTELERKNKISIHTELLIVIFFDNVIGPDMSLPHNYMYIQDTFILLDADLPKNIWNTPKKKQHGHL